MSSNILFPQFFLPFESIKLGRFTASIKQPHQEYHDPPCANAPEAIIALRNDYDGLHHSAHNTGFTTAITSLLSSGISRRAKTSIRIATDQVKTYTLGNSRKWFVEAMGLEETRKWVERAIDQGDDIYLVVGFHTISNARIVQESVQGREVGGQINLPIGLSLATIGAIAPLGNIVDPRVAGHRQLSEAGYIEFVAPGEQIFALQYRKVCHRWLSSRNVDGAFLSKGSRWAAYDRCRDDEEGVDDIIEVETEELQELEGNYERDVTSGGEILLLLLPENN
jgi:hypothetical protein